MRRNLAVLLIFMGFAAGCSDQAQAPKGPAGANPNAAVEVGIVTLKPETVPRYTELPGRIVANATAEIRPQVDGIIMKRLFQEGGPIKEGDPLYTLNDQKFKAALAAAQATLQKAEATVAGAQATLTRNQTLAASKAVSAQEVDTARTALLQAQADVEAAKADIAAAQINLDNTTVRAPISGIISTSSVSVGALVTANQTDALATIRQIDPVLVDLVDSSANLLRIRDEVKAGTLGRSGEAGPPKVTLVLENGDTYDHQGALSLANIVVSETTGTFQLRAVFENPDRILLPGMFVRARVNLGVMPNAFLVPQRAVTRDAAGQASGFFVGADDKAEARILTVSGSLGNDWLVTKGVQQGDRLIVDGFQKIREGSTVKPLAVTIDDNGVIEQTIPDAAKTEAAK